MKILILALFGCLPAAWGAEVFASVNGLQRPEVWMGTPLVVEGVVMNAEVPLAAEAWRVEVRDEKGGLQEWGFRKSPGVALEFIAESAVVASGSYWVRLVGHNLKSNDCRVVVKEKPVEAEALLIRRDLLWKVHGLRRQGLRAEALVMVEEHLRNDSEDVGALGLRADLLVELERRLEALAAYKLAIEKEEAERKRMQSREPAGSLYRKRDRILREMMTPI